MQLGSARSTSTVCDGVLPKSGPGIEHQLLEPHAARHGRARSARRAAAGRPPTMRPSKEGSSSFCLGAARVCMRISPAPVCAQTSASSGSRKRADVVDDRGAGGDRSRARPPACTCRSRRSRRARRRPARSAARRARSPRSLMTGGRLVTPDSPPMSITSAPAASSAARQLDALLERALAAVRERVGRRVDDPHQPDPAAERELPAGGREDVTPGALTDRPRFERERDALRGGLHAERLDLGRRPWRRPTPARRRSRARLAAACHIRATHSCRPASSPSRVRRRSASAAVSACS